MYRDYYYVRKRKFHFTLFQKVLICFLIIFILLLLFYITYRLINNISQNKEDYIEIIGYGDIEISKDCPYLILYNSPSNHHLLLYEIFNDNKDLLYTSELLYPGDEIYVNIIEQLNEYNLLTYTISVFDYDNKLISYLKQNQVIYVKNN